MCQEIGALEPSNNLESEKQPLRHGIRHLDPLCDFGLCFKDLWRREFLATSTLSGKMPHRPLWQRIGCPFAVKVLNVALNRICCYDDAFGVRREVTFYYFIYHLLRTHVANLRRCGYVDRNSRLSNMQNILWTERRSFLRDKNLIEPWIRNDYIVAALFHLGRENVFIFRGQ